MAELLWTILSFTVSQQVFSSMDLRLVQKKYPALLNFRTMDSV